MKKKFLLSLLAVTFVIVSVSWINPGTDAVLETSGAETSTVEFPHPVISPCNGDTIDMNGNVHVMTQTVDKKNGNTMIITHINFANIKGTARGSGDKYNCVSAVTQKVLIIGGETTATVHLNVTQDLIGKGKAPNLIFKLKQELLVDLTDGTHTVVSESVKFECKK